MNGKFLYIALVLVAVISAMTGALVWRAVEDRGSGEQPALLVLPEPREIPPFELVDQEGDAYGPDRLRGQWSMLFFGFTHCPDICPGTLFDLQQLQARLEKEGHSLATQVVFVSVDPERDTPDRLKNYVTYFSPEFIGVTGSHEQLLPLTRKLGIAYRISVHEDGAAEYTVDHSASVLLMDPQGRLYGVFPAPLDITAMAAELDRLES
ncbi:MAG: SCO family protein [Gammaproteobacteria bacterium]|nr:SCO family protein [Gammaproteobacteria bacterium]